MTDAMPDSYFESMYGDAIDPWGFDTRFYEHRKYDLTVASLPRRRYRRAYEPGCSNGALTERLARRCDQVVATDIIPAVVNRAAHRLRAVDGVDVRLARIPDEWPSGTFDLIVWSEVSYYLSAQLLDRAIENVDRCLAADGDLVIVNYSGATNYPLTADDVDRRVAASGFLRRRCGLVDDEFRLDVWTRVEPDHHAAGTVGGSGSATA